MNFFEELKEQQWDDLRYYHQNRINQSLHLFSAICFLITYVLLFVDFTDAVFFGWFIAMVPRQIGHFVFEPHEYDKVNNVTDEYKESIKVGYNMKRKVILISVWMGSSVMVYFYPAIFGAERAYANSSQFLHNLAIMWAIVAIGALLFRTAQIVYKQSLQSGMVWLYKIITEPLYNLPVYYKAPFLVLKGDIIDPMTGHRESKSTDV